MREQCAVTLTIDQRKGDPNDNVKVQTSSTCQTVNQVACTNLENVKTL